MGKKCVVPKCRSGLHTCKEKVSIFSIPKNKLELWQKALPIKNRPLTYRDGVCEKHFRKSDIIRVIATSVYSYPLMAPKLSPNAIPSLLHHCGSYQLRPRISDSDLASSSRDPPKALKQKRVAKPKPLRPWRDLTEAEKLETTLEAAFKVKLQENRREYNDITHLSKQQYNQLVLEVLRAQNHKRMHILKSYNVTVEKGVHKLTTPGKRLQFYVHDDELFHILQTAHVNLKHVGHLRMMTQLRKKYKNIAIRDVMTFVSLCHTCSQRQQERKNLKESVICSELSNRCSVNLIDYQSCPDDEYQFVLVYHNHLTKFCLLKALKSEAEREVAESLSDIFGFLGVSIEIESERESFFMERAALQLKVLWPGLCVTHMKTTESQILDDVRLVDEAIRKWMDDNDSHKWSQALPLIQLWKNTEFHEGIETAPYDSLFGLTQTQTLTKEIKVKEQIKSDETDPLVCTNPDRTCAECGSVEHKEGLCLNGLKKIIRRILPKSYKKWRNPGSSEDAFREKLQSIRQDHNCLALSKQSLALSKQQYDELVSQVTQAKIRNEILEQYDLIFIEGVTRLISPIKNHTFRYYVHDDELFYVLHYTHINLKHAWCYKMLKELQKRFENISVEAIIAYISQCPTCKEKRTHEKSADPVVYSELSARCSINFIDYQTHPDVDFEYVMVYQNSLTKFCLLKPLVSKQPEVVAYQLIDIFTLLGTPKIIDSDKRADLTEVIKQLKLVWSELEIALARSDNPEVASIKEDITNWMLDNKTTKWSKGLRFIQLARNRDYSSEIEAAPYDALFGLVDVAPAGKENVYEENSEVKVN